MRFSSVVLAILMPAIGISQDNVFTPQHIAKLRMVTEAVIAPDGAQVAYVLAVPRDIPREKDGPSWAELHVVDTKGNSTPFISGAVNVGSIAWTPDGKSIAFLTKRDGDPARSLYVIGVKGGEARKLVSHATDIQGYSFSGDGKQVAFLATEPTTAAKKKLSDQGFSQEIYEEDQPFVRVYVSPLPTGGEGPGVRGSAARMLNLPGSASELHWNPKEDKLAVALAKTPLIDEHIMFRKVHIVDLKTSKTTNLNNPGKLGQLAWSPDGKKLAMVTGKDKHDPKEGRLWVYHMNEKKWDDYYKKLSERAGHIESVAWFNLARPPQPGSWRPAVLESEGVYNRVWFVASTPVGIASNVSFAHANTNFAYIGQMPEHPPEVYLWAEDSLSRRLTDSNPWLKDMRFAKQEVVKYKARDGLELEGVLIRPLNEEKGKRYPLVLNVHGGPEAHYSNGWITNYNALGQVAAAKGMAVFYPNYRGSTGYGVEFSMKGQADAGGKEFDDLIDGVDHLVKTGLVDPKKVGITGGSYGGYATAWGSTYYSDRFAAGVMFVGISDWISCSGTTDIPQEMFLVHHRKWLWDDWDYFKKASPLAHLDKAKTPLLILHGKADPRVNPGQSLEMYRHLKVRNQAPVRLVLYPGEGHGNRRAASRLDYNLRCLQWMEHYLKGPGGKMPPLELDYGLTPTPAKTSMNWDTRRNEPEASATVRTSPWLARGCPCCIGW